MVALTRQKANSPSPCEMGEVWLIYLSEYILLRIRFAHLLIPLSCLYITVNSSYDETKEVNADRNKCYERERYSRLT